MDRRHDNYIFFESSFAGSHFFLSGEYYFGVLCYLYLFISRRQHAEWICACTWNKSDDFSSVVFLMNTNLFRFVMIALSSLWMSPALSRYNFTVLMSGIYCCLLKVLSF